MSDVLTVNKAKEIIRFCKKMGCDCDENCPYHFRHLGERPDYCDVISVITTPNKIDSPKEFVRLYRLEKLKNKLDMI